MHVLSLSNLTEAGTAYSAGELTERAGLARAAGLHVHLDGARFANALVSSDASPADLSWRAGVDVLSFGATKNGALACEGVLLFGDARRRFEDLRVRAKRAGHMPPKMRFTAAQMIAYLRDGLWLELARRANAAARRLGQVLADAGAVLVHPVDGNEVFARLPEGAAGRLSAAGLGFYAWADGSHRFVCAWSTTDDEIATAEKALAAG